MTSQPMQDWLAWVTLAWLVIATIWQVADEPVSRVYHSKMYYLVQVVTECVLWYAVIASLV